MLVQGTYVLRMLLAPGPSELGGGALYVEMGFYADISWESRCSIKINVRAHFYKILLVFEAPYQPRDKGMPKTTKSW